MIKLHDYRVAKEYKKDSQDFMRAIDLSIKALSFYKKYKPVAHILTSLIDEKAILMAHLNVANKILEKAKQ
jgi:hypothetical protein